MRSVHTVAALAALALAAPAGAQTVDPTIAPARDAEPVVMTGDKFGGWSVPAETTARLPFMDLTECQLGVEPSGISDPTEDGAEGLTGGIRQGCPEGYDTHNHYATPEVQTGPAQPEGTAVGRLLGYRWDAATKRFIQIPFQVDQVFTRYLNNTASGFAIYSGEDKHTTYAYDGPADREGFRYTKDGPADNPCLAQPATPAASDPVKGLDFDDEVAFMATDGGTRAPTGAPLPAGIQDVREVRVAESADPATNTARWVYVMRAKATGGPAPAFDHTNGYVRYNRDPGAGLFAFSESSYEGYGAAAAGLHCDAAGNVVRNADGTPTILQRRPRDGATITTGRYRYRYDGRWLMTAIEISPDGGKTYGPDLVDRWKARAFAQDPASETPCCGYEEEDTNWGGSSILLGERVGPVRAVRETWGADSGTNVIRRESFYRDAMNQRTWLRVHVIPPLDGIYAQWDFNAGAVDTFYNVRNKQGVAIDGRNDEMFGNFDDPCNANWDRNDTSATDQQYRTLYRTLQVCNFPYHQSVDPSDPTFSEANAGMGWTVTAGANGSIVDRIQIVPETSVGGRAQSLLSVPYYRDDSCFDDGTGSDPGPKINLRSGNEPQNRASDGTPRKCWHPEDGKPDGSDKFFQGSIATHGVHILTLAESDNARQTVPLTEIVSDWNMVMLPGRRGAADGERYGRAFEKPLVVTAQPWTLPSAPLQALGSKL